ncbi:uncharacterized protein KZ484_001697 isoform 2-T2 [Pholidichthys leucotaenia]
MILPGRITWCVLLTLHVVACGLDVSEHGSENVICSQGLFECTLDDDNSFTPENPVDTVAVTSIQSEFKLCCKDGTCVLCLEIVTEVYIYLDKNMNEEGQSGSGGEDDGEERSNSQVTARFPACKKVEFTVNHTALTRPHLAKISMVITQPEGFPDSSLMSVYPAKQMDLQKNFYAPSLEEVCSHARVLQKHVPMCQVPKVKLVVDEAMKEVLLTFDSTNETLPSVCVQYEKNGRCQRWNRPTIPLYSVTPCMCLQVWEEDEQISTRSLSCPFTNTDYQHILQKNIWENVSVSGRLAKMSNFGTMLLWNVSAPCMLSGEMWLLYRDGSNGIKNTTLRKKLSKKKWRQNSRGHWMNTVEFENIDLQPTPCVMVKIEGMEHKLDLFCFEKETDDRSRWSLLVIGVMLLVCLTAFLFYFLHGSVKEWVWSCRHGGLVKIGRKGHVLLLSPPDVDSLVSELVCQLGNFLCSQGFSVSVDQWSRKDQATLGLLPWLHSQLDSCSGRVLLVLDPKVLERVGKWSHCDTDLVKMKGGNKDLQQLLTPYSDLFTASLLYIHADKVHGRNSDRYALVTFDSLKTQTVSGEGRLPKLLQGLPLFRYPSQTQSLLAELSLAKGEKKSSGLMFTKWKSDTLKTKEQPKQHRPPHCKHVGGELETQPLNKAQEV